MNENGLEHTSRTDWARVDAQTDEDVDTSDSPPLTDDFFRRATWRKPKPVSVTIQVDPDVLAWFRAQGHGGERRMAAALRIYAEAHVERVDEHAAPVLGGPDEDAILSRRLAEVDRTPRVDGPSFLAALLERGGVKAPAASRVKLATDDA